jgi:hypothetical protein
MLERRAAESVAQSNELNNVPMTIFIGIMALYGQARDISMFRYINRELMHNIISQQNVFLSVNLNETVFNMYGEASEEKYYNGPLFYTL